MAGIKHHGIEDLTQFAMDVIRRSGEEALSFYGKGDRHIKFDEALVTEADSHLMNFFQDQLDNHFPEHQVFKNNPENKDYTHDGKRYIWIYDPLDGGGQFSGGNSDLGHFPCIDRKFLAYFRGILYAGNRRSFSRTGGSKSLLGR